MNFIIVIIIIIIIIIYILFLRSLVKVQLSQPYKRVDLTQYFRTCMLVLQDSLVLKHITQ